MNKRRVLLVGGSGQLGTEIVRTWLDWEIVAPSHEQLDFEDASALAAVLDSHRFDALANCSAFHNVDRCTAEPERAFAANAIAVGNAARACRERDIVFVTISTDYVFDGLSRSPYTEDASPRPISTYGASKLAGEWLVDLLQSKAFVVRTCGVYGVHASSSKGYTFVDRLISQARAEEKIRIVHDVVASPTYAGHLAEALHALVATEAYGLYHAANVGPVSWYDFACDALRQAGVAHRIEPISAADWVTGTRRPAYSALAGPKLEGLGIAMPSWQEGIAAYLRQKVGSDPIA